MTATKERSIATSAAIGAVRLWPNQSEAGKLIGVEPSTLLRRDLPFESYGHEKRFAPTTVLAETLYYKRVAPARVAALLRGLALEKGATREEARAISREADQFLIEHSELRAKQVTREEFLAEARRALPGGIYRQVEATYLQKGPGPTPVGRIKAEVGRLPSRVGQLRKKGRRRHA